MIRGEKMDGKRGELYWKTIIPMVAVIFTSIIRVLSGPTAPLLIG
jgi:hypothetical protein